MNNIKAALAAAAAAFVLTAILGKALIPVLTKLKFGQTILSDIGPRWHSKKQGTPTMGGWMFIISVPVVTVLALLAASYFKVELLSSLESLKTLETVKLVSGLLLAFCSALIGFADDYIKVRFKRNLGLTEMQKTVPQLLVIAAYLASLLIAGNTYMLVPFVGRVTFDSLPGMAFYCIFGAAVIYATINCANFTDGVDGLCAGVSVPIAAGLSVMAFIYKSGFAGITAAALAGALMGYLIYNRCPARVMMGDTGSNFIGALVAALAFCIDCPLIIAVCAVVYVIEGLSDVLQILSIKLFSKKLIKMAPIHHHLEMIGWREEKIALTFSLISLAGSAAAVYILYLTIK